MDAFSDLETLIDTMKPTGTAAAQRARRLVERAVAAAQPSPELSRAMQVFESAFDCLAASHEFDPDWDGLRYLHAGARQRLRELRAFAPRAIADQPIEEKLSSG